MLESQIMKDTGKKPAAPAKPAASAQKDAPKKPQQPMPHDKGGQKKK